MNCFSRKVPPCSDQLNSSRSFHAMRTGLFRMLHSVISATFTAQPPSSCGLIIILSPKLTVRVCRTTTPKYTRRCHSGISSSSFLTPRCVQHMNMPVRNMSFSRVTFLSASVVMVLRRGSNLATSISMLRLVHRLMPSPKTDRTGDSLHTTGMLFLPTGVLGGYAASGKCQSTSMLTVSTTYLASSASGRFLSMRFTVFSATSPRHSV